MGDATVRRVPGIEWGVVSQAFPGETECGDRHLVTGFQDGALVAVIDGLGHGEEAAAAANVAVSTLERHAGEPVISLVARCHKELKRTRGVVMSLASFNTRDNLMTSMGVGSIEGILFRAGSGGPEGRSTPTRQRVFTVGGVVGFQLPTIRSVIVSVAEGDTLIFATDGISSEFAQSIPWGLSPQEIANSVFARHFKGTDDGLVLVARYLGGVLGKDGA